MFTHTLRKLGVAAALVAFAMVPATLPASAARSDQVTVFKGQFVCAVGGEQLPLAAAPVYLDQVGHFGSSGFLGIIGGTGDVFGVAGVQSGLTGPDGEFHLEAPFSSDNNQDYAVRVVLADGYGFTVREWPTGDRVTFSTGTNQNDVPVQDYHTQVLTNPECGVWLAFEAAAAQYKRVTGHRVGELAGFGPGVEYGGPSLNAFEANGDLGDADSAVVHSDATGLTTLTVKGTSKHPIAYVAIFSNGYWQQGPNLVFDNFAYTSH